MFIKKWWSFTKKDTVQKKTGAIKYSSLTKVYMPAQDLTLGMYVTELDRSWLDSPFLFQGFEIKNERELSKLREVCEYVYIDMSKSHTKKNIAGTSTNPKRTKTPEDLPKPAVTQSPPKKLGGFEKEIARAENAYIHCHRAVVGFMNSINRGASLDGKLAKEAVAECVSVILNSPDAMLWLSQLKKKDQYTAQHSLNVSVLSIILGRYLNYPKKHLHLIGLCGLMHDMGKMKIPSEILNKPGKLDPDEFRIMQTHTQLGYELLSHSDGIHLSAAETALSHHERMNGKGYPRRLCQDDIPFIVRIVSIADVYDAVTSDKVYQQSKTHLEAIEILSENTESQFDRQLVYKFIESLGLYPPGCLVEMTNGAIAIVLEVNEAVKLRPKIAVILDEEKNPVKEKILDLSSTATDKRGKRFGIKGTVKAADWNIDLSKYHRENLMRLYQ